MRKTRLKGFWLLSDASDNIKTAKTAKAQKDYRVAMLSLSPYTSSGYQVCPMAQINKCFDDCLFFSGKGGLPSVQETRSERTKLFFEDRERFFSLLCADIDFHVAAAEKEGKSPCIRLNGLSDIPWESIPIPGEGISIIAKYPNVQFYDYTKVWNRLGYTPSNYQLTFSHSAHWPKSEALALQALSMGHNVTVIFPVKRGNPLPSSHWGFPVIDGDVHDLRFLDNSPVVVGLRFKHPVGKR